MKNRPIWKILAMISRTPTSRPSWERMASWPRVLKTPPSQKSSDPITTIRSNTIGVKVAPNASKLNSPSNQSTTSPRNPNAAARPSGSTISNAMRCSFAGRSVFTIR